LSCAIGATTTAIGAVIGTATAATIGPEARIGLKPNSRY
jgi:hypothetical protein